MHSWDLRHGLVVLSLCESLQGEDCPELWLREAGTQARVVSGSIGKTEVCKSGFGSINRCASCQAHEWPLTMAGELRDESMSLSRFPGAQIWESPTASLRCRTAHILRMWGWSLV